jgi:hypothetical protein
VEVIQDDNTGSTGFYQVLAIVSLTQIKFEGSYSNRSKRPVRNQIDQFLIVAELQKVKKRGQDSHFASLPYPVYKYRVPVGRRAPKIYLTAISIDDIYRPACFPEVYANVASTKKFNRSSPKMENHLHVRFYGFDLKSCDASMWNSTTDIKTNNPFFIADQQQREEAQQDFVPPQHQHANVASNVINFLLDEEALQNAVIDLNIEQDCATDSDEDSIDEHNDSASSVDEE